MAVQTTATGQMVPAAQAKTDLVALTGRYLPEIKRALPAHLSADRMQRIFVTALNSNPDLLRCTPISWLASMLHLAQLGLEPNTPLGHAALVPLWNERKGVYECAAWLMYQGMIELVMRSGTVASILPQVVKDGDTFTWEEGLDPILRHRPSDLPDREERRTTHAYVVVQFTNGARAFRVVTRAQIEKARAASRYGNRGPWVEFYDEQGMKTAVKRMFKYLPKSADLARAIAAEEIHDATGASPLALLNEYAQQRLEQDGLREEAVHEQAQAVVPEKPATPAAGRPPCSASPAVPPPRPAAPQNELVNKGGKVRLQPDKREPQSATEALSFLDDIPTEDNT